MAFSDQASEVTWQHFHSTLLGEVVMSPQIQGEGTLTAPLNDKNAKTRDFLFKAPHLL